MNTLVLLLATAVVGQLPATSEASAKATLTYHKQLPGALRMPVFVSPDEKSLLYFTRVMQDDADGKGQPRHVYKLADIDGGNPRDLFTTPIEWDDCLNAVTTPQAFCGDGRRFAVATTDNDRPMRDREDPGRVVPAVIKGSGEVRKIACALGSCGGFGFVGSDLLVLDTPGLISGQGYQLSIHRHLMGEAKPPRVIHKDEKVAASCLRISRDGKHAAFFTSKHVGSSIVRVRSVDLATGKHQDSPEFRSQSATFDGRPQLFWDYPGEGVYCHVSTHERSKWPFELTHYKFGDGKGFVACPLRNVGASCTLGFGRLAMWHPDAGGGSVLSVADGDIFPLPDHNYLLGGNDRHVVVADLERNAVYAATLDLSH